jgi:hypothetical protein
MNPRLAALPPLPDCREIELAVDRVPGDFIGAASRELPPAGPASDAPLMLTIDAAWASVVCFNFHR